MDGIINLDKPSGITSHDAVALVRRLAPGVKVGHAGTLDPAATGVLPLCLGRATRVSQYILEMNKSYCAAINLGITTTTGDAEGDVITSVDPPHFKQSDVEKVIDSLKLLQLQVIPPYAAAKHRGRPFYEYARRGKKVPIRMRSIRIYHSKLLNFSPESAPQITFEVECSKGTYI
ncbi:MAG: tRNA pseudouridine(55) synthase TruB, partial [Firmicutes bacterium]|nr:tRNA pseudouridine(55) synthase TruB [Bacillota bacterium]